MSPYAFITTVVSEWLGGFEGLGVYMIQSKKLFQYDTMFAIIILVSIISLLGMKLVDISENMLLNGNVRRIRMFLKRKEEIEMKKTWKVFLTVLTALVAVVLVACGQGTASKDNKEAELKKIDFILDWTPNTNHTGLYVAKEKGYFKEAGVDVDLKLPPEESSSDLVINGKAPFAVYFQDYMAKNWKKEQELLPLQLLLNTIHQESSLVNLTM